MKMFTKILFFIIITVFNGEQGFTKDIHISETESKLKEETSTLRETLLEETVLNINSEEQMDSKLFVQLLKILQQEVILEIEFEAEQAGLNRSVYTHSAESMTHFTKSLESIIIEELTRKEKIALLVKTSIRLQIQRSSNSVSEGFYEKERKVLAILEKIAVELGIQTENPRN